MPKSYEANLGPQFLRSNARTGRRGGSRSEPWMTAAAATRTFQGSRTFRVKGSRPSTLRMNIARSGRGERTH